MAKACIAGGTTERWHSVSFISPFPNSPNAQPPPSTRGPGPRYQHPQCLGTCRNSQRHASPTSYSHPPALQTLRPSTERLSTERWDHSVSFISPFPNSPNAQPPPSTRGPAVNTRSALGHAATHSATPRPRPTHTRPLPNSSALLSTRPCRAPVPPTLAPPTSPDLRCPAVAGGRVALLTRGR
jgi:hypothetical protein